MKILLFISISIVAKMVFRYIYPESDVDLYQRKYENGISKGISQGKFYDWLFTRFRIEINGKLSNTLLPYYRIEQSCKLLAYWFIYFQCMRLYVPVWLLLIDLSGVIIAYYFMVYEYQYYKIAKQIKLLSVFEQFDPQTMSNTNTYWLKRIYFSGKWLFKTQKQQNGYTDFGFKQKKFYFSFILGTYLMVFTSLIYIKLLFN